MKYFIEFLNDFFASKIGEIKSDVINDFRSNVYSNLKVISVKYFLEFFNDFFVVVSDFESIIVSEILSMNKRKTK